MKIFGIEFKKRRRVSEVTPKSRQVTPRQAKMRFQSFAVESFLEYAKENPEVAVKLGKQIMGYKDDDYSDMLLQEAAERDPQIRQQIVAQALRVKGMNSGDWMQQFREMREFFDEVGSDGGWSRKPSSGLLASILNPDTVSAIVQGFMMLQQMQHPTTTHALPSGNNHVNSEVPKLSSQARVVDDHREDMIIPGNVQQYIDELSEAILDEDTTPETAARVALFTLNSMAIDLETHNIDTKVIEQLNNILGLPPQTLLTTLKVFASSLNNARYAAVVEKLEKNNMSYLIAFCTERDRIYKEMEERNKQK